VLTIASGFRDHPPLSELFSAKRDGTPRRGRERSEISPKIGEADFGSKSQPRLI